MIYCVVPEALEEELFEKLTAYYADDDNVTVIVDRRKADRRNRRGDGRLGSAEARSGGRQAARDARSPPPARAWRLPDDRSRVSPAAR